MEVTVNVKVKVKTSCPTTSEYVLGDGLAYNIEQIVTGADYKVLDWELVEIIPCAN